MPTPDLVHCLIVDDCPDEVHIRLSKEVNREDSRCLLMTIGVETKAHGMHRNLIVQLNAASNELIGHIAEATNKIVSNKNASLIRNLSQGFPKMAVLASWALEGGDEELSSVETLISRIVWGEHEIDQSAFESLKFLNLFTIVGMENDAAHELEELAFFCGKTRRQIYNESLSEEMKLRMVGRLRWVSWSDKVTNFGRALLSEALSDEVALDSEFGSRLLNRLVHLAPDATREHLDRLFSGKSIDELTAFYSGRRYTIFALEKLVFRRQTFDMASRLTLNLGAAENEGFSNNASGHFTGLFHLHLSSTADRNISGPETSWRIGGPKHTARF